MIKTFGQDDSRRDDWSRERPSTDLVDAADETEPLGLPIVFERLTGRIVGTEGMFLCELTLPLPDERLDARPRVVFQLGPYLLPLFISDRL
jgi:hypothetical protein